MSDAAAVHDPFVPEAVVFDMDGLLLDTEGPARDAMREAAAESGLTVPPSLSLAMIGAPVDACRELLVGQFGADVPVDRIFARAAALLEATIDAEGLRVKPGVLAVLRWLDDEALPRAVATSSMRAKAMHHLRAAGIGDRFEVVVTRDDVAHGKPHPDLYLLAARRLGRLPERCLAFEDSHNGVRAAHRAGMPVVMVPDLLPATDEMRQLGVAVVDSLEAVLPRLRARRAAMPARG